METQRTSYCTEGRSIDTCFGQRHEIVWGDQASQLKYHFSMKSNKYMSSACKYQTKKHLYLNVAEPACSAYIPSAGTSQGCMMIPPKWSSTLAMLLDEPPIELPPSVPVIIDTVERMQKYISGIEALQPKWWIHGARAATWYKLSSSLQTHFGMHSILLSDVRLAQLPRLNWM